MVQEDTHTQIRPRAETARSVAGHGTEIFLGWSV